MVSKLDQTLRFHSSALAVRAERQQMLSSNIANADTPNFKAKDVDFAAALKVAMGSKPAAPGVVRTSARHMLPANESALSTQVVYRTPRQVNVDGNTVDLDVERAQFANNAVHYEANLTFLSMQIKGLLSAIQG